jgi:histone-binding protein RBBP4
VAWHGIHPDIFASVGDDKKLMIWDLREKSPRSTTEAHTAEVNCVQFNPTEENLLATGSADRNVVLHDMRNLQQRLHCMQAHKEEVFQVQPVLLSLDVCCRSG